MLESIDHFDGPFAFLSNFHPAPVKYGPFVFPTVEHAYQFAKLPKEKMSAAVVERLQQATAAKAKAFGRGLHEKNLVRPDWEDIKEKVMRYLLEQKFLQSELQEWLLRTGTADLVEGNVHHDNVWGDCRCTTVKPNERRFGQKQSCHMRGKNKLGHLLMEIRAQAFVRSPFRCPTCGCAEEIAQLDLVPAFARGRFEHGVFVFGETELDWPRQGPRDLPPHYWCYACQAEFTVPVQEIAAAPAA